MSRFVDTGGSIIRKPVPPPVSPKVTPVEAPGTDMNVQEGNYIIKAIGEVPQGLGKGNVPAGWRKITLPVHEKVAQVLEAAKPEALIQKEKDIYVEYYNIITGPIMGVTTAFARYIYFKEDVSKDVLKKVVEAYV